MNETVLHGMRKSRRLDKPPSKLTSRSVALQVAFERQNF
jgi:hypothetical protein